MVLQDLDAQLFHDTVRARSASLRAAKDSRPRSWRSGRPARMAAVGSPATETHLMRLARSRRQLAAVAGALAAEPDLPVLDEPTGGLDRDAFERVARAVVDAAEERGAGVLLINARRRPRLLATRTVTLAAPPPAPSVEREEAPDAADGTCAPSRPRRWQPWGSWSRRDPCRSWPGRSSSASCCWARRCGMGRAVPAPRWRRWPRWPVSSASSVTSPLRGWVDDPATHAALLVLRLVGMVVWTVWALAKGDGEQGIALCPGVAAAPCRSCCWWSPSRCASCRP